MLPFPAGPRGMVAARAQPALHAHHVRRLERVVDYVDAHLDECLSLERMATVAAISPFHFHRLFQAWAGETLNEFVRRRRLEVAAGRLRHCREETVTAIALNCGFSSPEVFARVFRDHFGRTPSQWRREGDAAQGAVCASAVRVAQQGPVDVLFMRARGDFHEVAPPLWARFTRAVQTMGLDDRPLLMMGLDDPGITPAGRCRLDACVALPADAPSVIAAVPLLHKRIPSCRVATLPYEGPPAGIRDAWRMLLAEWLPESPFQLAIGPFIERHDPLGGQHGGALVRCTLAMPVEPRAA